MKAYLKHKIIESYQHSTEKGYTTIEEFESIVDLFNSYKELGGNGTCEKIFEDFKRIPIKD